MRDERRLAAFAGVLGVLIVAPVFGFHDGGVASCGSCHIMHETEDGLSVIAGPDMLRADNSSDLCLSCHAEDVGEVLGLDPTFPPDEKGAGNFVYLNEENINDGVDGSLPENWLGGHYAGHNVVAPAYGLVPDLRNAVAPGGTFPSDQLGCTSCHDPHGRDTFRMLYGMGPIQGGLVTFDNPAPIAEGIPLDSVESPANHSAYQSGMNDWCANCHGMFHDNGEGGLEHPYDEPIRGDERNQYNSYQGEPLPDGSDCLPLVTQANAYLPEVPFESDTMTTSSTEGPSVGGGGGPGGTVICLTCHRAHATSAPAAMRWDHRVALLDDDGVESGSYAIPNPYCSTQSTLCTKCHDGGPPEATAAEVLGTFSPWPDDDTR